MRLVLSTVVVFLAMTVACQSGSGGTGVATADQAATGGEATTAAGLSQGENRDRTSDRETRSEEKAREELMRQQDRIDAARERDRVAQEAWTAGAAERLSAEAEKTPPETEPDPSKSSPRE